MSDKPDATIESPELEAAATWWADHLGDKKQDAGDEAVNVVSAMFHCAPVPTDEQKGAFVQSFVRRAAEHCNGVSRFTVGVDYGPDQILAASAKDAGYPDTNGSFPIKTIMWIIPGSVKVSHGYGAAVATIFPPHNIMAAVEAKEATP